MADLRNPAPAGLTWARRNAAADGPPQVEVVCFPLVRPGQAVYHGHNGMIKLVDYMHDLHGDYQIEMDDITERDLPKGKVKVTAQVRILPEPGPGRVPEVAVTSVYTVQDGLITWIDSNPRTQG